MKNDDINDDLDPASALTANHRRLESIDILRGLAMYGGLQAMKRQAQKADGHSPI